MAFRRKNFPLLTRGDPLVNSVELRCDDLMIRGVEG